MIEYTYTSKRKTKDSVTVEVHNVRDLFRAACDEVGLNMTEHPRFGVNASYSCKKLMTPEKLKALFDPTDWNVEVTLKHKKTKKLIDYFDIND
jgi:hypothetical protein